jgi:sirohydrochlorin cobaltochelatase
MAEKLGIMVCGHGSRNSMAVAQFARVAEGLRAAMPGFPVEYGYLEFANPIIKDGLDKLRAQGVNRVLAVPGMLFAAGHAKNDIPSVLNTYAAGHEDFTIDYGKDLGIDPKMMQAAAARVQQALDDAKGDVPLEETMLMVVGRGASDPDANSNISKITRLLWEGFGFGWAETCYSGVTFPLVEPGLTQAVKLGFKRVVVFPYFLFTGVLVNRIYQHTDLVAEAHPDIEFIKAPYLNDHPKVIETFVERVEQILTGDNNMNCGMCKYRNQVLGFEDQVGLAQESHHHHVEGVSAGCELCEDECTGACQVADILKAEHGHSHSHKHEHDHAHHPYPHADHPLGPKTLKDSVLKSQKP